MNDTASTPPFKTYPVQRICRHCEAVHESQGFRPQEEGAPLGSGVCDRCDREIQAQVKARTASGEDPAKATDVVLQKMAALRRASRAGGRDRFGETFEQGDAFEEPEK